jgi:hypothetical protein
LLTHLGSNQRPLNYESGTANGELNQFEYSVYCGEKNDYIEILGLESS